MAENYRGPDFSQRVANKLGIDVDYCRTILKALGVNRVDTSVTGQLLPVRTLDDGDRRSSQAHVRTLVEAYRNIETALTEGRYSSALKLADDNKGRNGLPLSFLNDTVETAFEGSLLAGNLHAKDVYEDDYDPEATRENFAVARRCLVRAYNPGGIDERKSTAVKLVGALMESDLYGEMVSVLKMRVADPDKPSEKVPLFNEEERRGYIATAATRLKVWIADIIPVGFDDVKLVKILTDELGDGAFEKDVADTVRNYADTVQTHRSLEREHRRRGREHRQRGSALAERNRVIGI